MVQEGQAPGGARSDVEPLGPAEHLSAPGALVQPLVQAAVGHALVQQELLPLAGAVAQQRHEIVVPDVAQRQHLGRELPLALRPVLDQLLDGHHGAVLELGLVHHPESSVPDDVGVVEIVGGHQQIHIGQSLGQRVGAEGRHGDFQQIAARVEPVSAHLGEPRVRGRRIVLVAHVRPPGRGVAGDPHHGQHQQSAHDADTQYGGRAQPILPAAVARIVGRPRCELPAQRQNPGLGRRAGVGAAVVAQAGIARVDAEGECGELVHQRHGARQIVVRDVESVEKRQVAQARGQPPAEIVVGQVQTEQLLDESQRLRHRAIEVVVREIGIVERQLVQQVRDGARELVVVQEQN
ncbi:hypothetical protein Mapa_009538 [Marchantia paleacea]|nr:hypothetical protein Mapa_009538 [Marchantia paleacea]